MGKIPNFMDSERLKTPKTDCALKVYQDNEFWIISLHSRFVDLENSEFPATLRRVTLIYTVVNIESTFQGQV